MGMFVYFVQMPPETTQEFTINWEDIKELIQPEQTIASTTITRPSFIPLDWKMYNSESKNVYFWYPEDGYVEEKEGSIRVFIPEEDDEEMQILSIREITDTAASALLTIQPDKEMVAIGGLIGHEYEDQKEKMHLVIKNVENEYLHVSYPVKAINAKPTLLETVLMSLQLE